jgi:hypothetical protein
MIITYGVYRQRKIKRHLYFDGNNLNGLLMSPHIRCNITITDF